MNFLSFDLCNPRRPSIFQTIYSVRWNNLSLKYQRFTPPSGWKDVGIRKFKFVAKTFEPENYKTNISSNKMFVQL